MTGEIRGADVLRHPVLIARGFGLRALGRCLLAIVAGRPCTFLSLVTR